MVERGGGGVEKGVRALSGEMGVFYKLNSGCTQIVKNDQTDVYILLMLMYQMISNVDIMISII